MIYSKRGSWSHGQTPCGNVDSNIYLEFDDKNDVVYNSYTNLFANTSCNKGCKGSIKIWVAIRIFTTRSS